MKAKCRVDEAALRLARHNIEYHGTDLSLTEDNQSKLDSSNSQSISGSDVSKIIFDDDKCLSLIDEEIEENDLLSPAARELSKRMFLQSPRGRNSL